MNSVGEECNELKQKYDACFNVWYTEHFLKGEIKTDPCSEMLKTYRTCVLKAIKQKNIHIEDIEKEVLNTPLEKQPPEL